MGKKISESARAELIEATRSRYVQASKKDKTKILDELVKVFGCHRKHAIRMLANPTRSESEQHGRQVYDQAVREALTVLWEAADRICGKRWKAILPVLVESMVSRGHLQLDPTVQEMVLAVSPATIDRLLRPVRSPTKARRKRRASKIIRKIPVRTFSEWKDVVPGFLEIDFVVHCGGAMKGSYIHSLAATDVCSGWTEVIPLLVREQSLVVQGLNEVRNRLPMPMLGINTDNDSAFINDTLVTYCEKEQIQFTRARAYRKNDQALAWIEQKNGAIVRRFVGYARFSGIAAGRTMAQLYEVLRLYVNYFQPSFKLRSKLRHGAKVRKTYWPPATTCDRLLGRADISEDVKDQLRSKRGELDPVALLHRIRKLQSVLASVASHHFHNGAGNAGLEQFLAELPHLWKAGEVRPTHRVSEKQRHRRTRKDPFEDVWTEVLHWLEKDPEATAKDLFERLNEKYECFQQGQLRSLQRRIREWRQVMARKLVFPGSDSDELDCIE